MSNHITPIDAARNETILTRVEALGGGYVWDAEVFAVTCMDVAIADADAMTLTGLTGAQQIALDCSRLSFSALKSIAAIDGLQSLVICNPAFNADDLQLLEAVGPEIQVVEK